MSFAPHSVATDPAGPRARALQPPLPVRPGESIYWEGLYGSSGSIALTAAAAQASAPLLVLTAEPHAAAQLIGELRFYGAAAEPVRALQFPGWEILPYDVFSPYQDIVSERLATLVNMPRLRRAVLVTTVATAMHRLLPSDFLARHSLLLQTGQTLEVEAFRRTLVESGYRFVSQVGEHGDAAIRGSILDIFPMGADQPYRVDLFDDVVDSIRTFDPESQRSVGRVEGVRVLPAREVALNDAGIARFRSNWRSRFTGNPNASAIYRDVSSGFAPAGIEYYLPLFFDSTQSLFDYLPGGCLVVYHENAEDAAARFWTNVQARYEQGRHDVERPLLAPEEVFYSPGEFLAMADRFRRIYLCGLPTAEPAGNRFGFGTRVPTAVPVDARARDPLAVFRKFQSGFGGRILVAAESPGRRESLYELFSEHELRPQAAAGWMDFLGGDQRLAITVAPLDNGALLADPEIAVVCEAQLFGDRVQQRRLRRRRQHDSEAVVRNLTELTPGAPVVHLDHGVGRFQGLATLTVGDVQGEYICLEYAGGDRLYVPVNSLELIARYTGVDPEHA
ncbi:MAG: transcription-repair coupling factor, partial [Gammaproteobacteria bacterium]|nr:transcription-repair coupling factor [Gammaproteobacteria bacterium]